VRFLLSEGVEISNALFGHPFGGIHSSPLFFAQVLQERASARPIRASQRQCEDSAVHTPWWAT
jgi:hypothetical protein